MEEFLSKWEADQARLRDHLRGQGSRFQALGETLEGVRVKGRNVFMFGETSLEDIARVIAVEFLRSWPVVPISLYDDDLSDLEDLLAQGPASKIDFPKDVPEKVRQLVQCFREGDAILAFVHEGESNTLRQTLRYARKLKVKILLVGGVGGKSELREPADVFLTLPTRGIKTLCEASFVCARLIARFARAEALEKSPDETAALRAWSKIQDPKIQDPKIQDLKPVSDARLRTGRDGRGRSRAEELDEADFDEADADFEDVVVEAAVDRRRAQTSQERRRKSKRRPQTGRIDRAALVRENTISEAYRNPDSELLELDAELKVELDDEPLELLEASPEPERKPRGRAREDKPGEGRSRDSSRRSPTAVSKGLERKSEGSSERRRRETRQRDKSALEKPESVVTEKAQIDAGRERRDSHRGETARERPGRGDTEKNRRDSRGDEVRRSKTEQRIEERGDSAETRLPAAESERGSRRDTATRERAREKAEREGEAKSRKRSAAEASEARGEPTREGRERSPESQKNRAAVLSTASEPQGGYPNAWLGDNESVEGPLGLRQSTQSKGPEKSSNNLLDLGLESEDLLPRYIRDALDPAAQPLSDDPPSLGESGEGQRFVSNRFRVQECQLRFHSQQHPSPDAAVYTLASLQRDSLSFRIAADDAAVESLCPGETLFVSLDIPAFLEPIAARARILGFDAHEDEDDLRVTLEIQSLGEDERRRLELAAETISSKGTERR